VRLSAALVSKPLHVDAFFDEEEGEDDESVDPKQVTSFLDRFELLSSVVPILV